MAARGNRSNHAVGTETGLQHHCCHSASEQRPAENPRAAVSAVPKIQCRSRVKSRCLGERLRGIRKDADYVGSVRAEIGSAKIRARPRQLLASPRLASDQTPARGGPCLTWREPPCQHL